MRVLVTGGAGYIGSHAAHLLLKQGYEPIAVDNFSSGNKWAVEGVCEWVEGDCGNSGQMADLLKRYEIRDVLHFAAHIEVEESVSDPLKYYHNNLGQTVGLLKACSEAQVERFIFSSTAAVYGEPDAELLPETTPLQPVNPYGFSKFAAERVVSDWALAEQRRGRDMRFLILRYFNVAGAQMDEKTRKATLCIGEAPPHSTHLIKIAAETACGIRPQMKIFGQDYATLDGTCVRDYVHVDDLASAHISALSYLQKGGESARMNCGYGHGYSVKQVIECFQKVCGVDFPVVMEKRRPGDVASLVADSSRLKSTLAWKPKYDSIEVICESAFEWEKKLKSLRNSKS